MNDKESFSSVQKAKEYAFFLLKFRLRTEKELYQRLKNKKFTEDSIAQALGFLKEKGFIDDNGFAKAWIESRIKKPLGIRRLEQELKKKGIDKEIIESLISKVKKGYNEEAIVMGLVMEKASKLKGIDPLKAKRRIYGYLLRRGFSPDKVIDAVNRLQE